MSDVSRGDLIEQRIDKDVARDLTVGSQIGGVRIQSMLEVMEAAKLMSISKQAVPAHLRENPGMCLAIVLQAVEWNMSPFAVANKSYVTNDRLNYESQLIHAVIEARAPLKKRLEVRYEGAGEERVCIVSGWIKGEEAPRELRSQPLGKARPSKNEYGKVKGSPLWEKKPDVQLFYDTSRDFCRIFLPDVLLGIYTPDEVEQYGVGEEAKDVTAGASLRDRLGAAQPTEEGHRHGWVEEVLSDAAKNNVQGGQDASTASPAPERRRRGRKAHDALDAAGTGSTPEVGGSPGEGEGQAADGAAPPADPPADYGAGRDWPAGTESGFTGLPTTPAQYVAWFDQWLADLDPADCNDRWVAEMQLRNKCGVTIAVREPMEVKLKEKIAEVS